MLLQNQNRNIIFKNNLSKQIFYKIRKFCFLFFNLKIFLKNKHKKHNQNKP